MIADQKYSPLKQTAVEGRNARIMDSAVSCSGTISEEYISLMVWHTSSKVVVVPTGAWGTRKLDDTTKRIVMGGCLQGVRRFSPRRFSMVWGRVDVVKFL